MFRDHVAEEAPLVLAIVMPASDFRGSSSHDGAAVDEFQTRVHAEVRIGPMPLGSSRCWFFVYRRLTCRAGAPASLFENTEISNR
jgi:hypothetical protein